MVIISKKKFKFARAADGAVFVTKGGNEIQNAPDWIESNALFALAKKDGDIIVAESPKTVSAPVEDTDAAQRAAAEKKSAEAKKKAAAAAKKETAKKAAAEKKAAEEQEKAAEKKAEAEAAANKEVPQA